MSIKIRLLTGEVLDIEDLIFYLEKNGYDLIDFFAYLANENISYSFEYKNDECSKLEELMLVLYIHFMEIGGRLLSALIKGKVIIWNDKLIKDYQSLKKEIELNKGMMYYIDYEDEHYLVVQSRRISK